jgi:hypothetical protein
MFFSLESHNRRAFNCIAFQVRLLKAAIKISVADDGNIILSNPSSSFFPVKAGIQRISKKIAVKAAGDIANPG